MDKVRGKLAQRIYENAGGGAEGEAAVKAYYEYLEQSNAMITEMLREKKRNRFLPKSEKDTATIFGIDVSIDDDPYRKYDLKDQLDRACRFGRYSSPIISEKEEEDER